MGNSLQTVIEAIALAKNEAELRSHFMDTVGNYLAVPRWGIYLLDRQNRLASVDVYGVSDRFVNNYEKFGREIDPLLDYVSKYHTPVHEQLIFGTVDWKQSLLYKSCCSQENHEHIMTGPIVGNGSPIGTVHFARVGDTPAFNQKNLADLGAICLHLSANLARIRAESGLFTSVWASYLTPRELQIAELVARGLTNAEIGKQLWISQNTVKQTLKRIFRKLEVSSRLEMVLKIQNFFASSNQTK